MSASSKADLMQGNGDIPRALQIALERMRRVWLEDDEGNPIAPIPFVKRSLANLDRLFSDAGEDGRPAGSAANGTDYAAQLSKTWATLDKDLRAGDWSDLLERLPETSAFTIPSIEDQWAVLLDLFATLPESIDAGMKDALTSVSQLRDDVSDTAIRLRDLCDSLMETCEQHGISYPRMSHVGDLVHEIVETVNEWEPVPPLCQEFAVIGDGNAQSVSGLVRHFDARLRLLHGSTVPPDFMVGDTDLARIINALRRPAVGVSSQGVLKARR